MDNPTEMILRKVKEEGLHKAMGYFSTFVKSAPKKRIPTNAYNTYTPKGQGTTHNPNFKSQLVVWKNEKLFPFFLEHGFTKKELNDAWKISVFKK